MCDQDFDADDKWCDKLNFDRLHTVTNSSILNSDFGMLHDVLKCSTTGGPLIARFFRSMRKPYYEKFVL